MGKINVMLVEDHAIVRTGLRLLLERDEDIEVVGEAADGVEAIEKAGELSPDVILMDITMPRVNGLQAATQIRKKDSRVGILFLTMHKGDEYFFQSLKVGGAGYIPKSADETEMLSAVKAVNAGQAYIHPSVARSLVSDFVARAQEGKVKEPYETLSDREREVLYFIAAGHTNRDIADALYLSVNTIHNHRTSIMGKLGLHNQVELLKYAIRKGLISEED